MNFFQNLLIKFPLHYTQLQVLIFLQNLYAKVVSTTIAAYWNQYFDPINSMLNSRQIRLDS